jgi:hypothetical protein
VICEANFIYLQACHLFTLQTQTFWDDVFDLVSHRPPKSYSWRSTLVRTHEPRFLELPEVRRFLSFLKFASSYLPEFARFQLSWKRRHTRDPGSIRQLFRTMLEDQRIMQNHQNTFTNVCLSRNRFSATRHIHKYIHKFSNSDVSRGKGFYPIPQLKHPTCKYMQGLCYGYECGIPKLPKDFYTKCIHCTLLDLEWCWRMFWRISETFDT